jgi:hypothetical protein
MPGAVNIFLDKIREGEIYTVEMINEDGGIALVEVPGYVLFYGRICRHAYHPDRFVPCSEVDELSFNRKVNIDV